MNTTSHYGEVSAAGGDDYLRVQTVLTDYLLVFGLVFSAPFLVAIRRLSQNSYSAEGGTFDEHRITQQLMSLLFFIILTNCIFHGVALATPAFPFESRATLPSGCLIKAAIVNMSVSIAVWLVACVSHRIYVSLSKNKGKFLSNKTYLLVSICPTVVTTTVLSLREKLGASGQSKPGDMVDLCWVPTDDTEAVALAYPLPFSAVFVIGYYLYKSLYVLQRTLGPDNEVMKKVGRKMIALPLVTFCMWLPGLLYVLGKLLKFLPYQSLGTRVVTFIVHVSLPLLSTSKCVSLYLTNSAVKNEIRSLMPSCALSLCPSQGSLEPDLDGVDDTDAPYYRKMTEIDELVSFTSHTTSDRSLISLTD